MNKLSILLLLLALMSCHHDQLTPSLGRATFSLSITNRLQTGGRITQTSIPASVILSIQDSNGKLVLQNTKLSLYTFGLSYVSESLELTGGSYKLVQFKVLDANDTVIYASPLVGSVLAQYVSNPLPINFTITKDASTQVVPQVLALPSFEFSLSSTINIERVTIDLENGSEKHAMEITAPGSNIIYNSDSLIGKKWNASIIVWLKKDSCFQRIKRYKGQLDFMASSSLILPSIDSAQWRNYFYSEIACGAYKIKIFRSTNYKNLTIEVNYPQNVSPYYSYADEGYWDGSWTIVCGMPYVELYGNPNPEFVQLPYNCNADPFYIDDLIVMDLPCGHYEDYFVWTSDNKPYCQN